MADIALQITVDAAPAAVRDAVTTREGIAGWFTSGVAVDGGVQLLTFPGYPGGPWRFEITEESAQRVAMSVVAGPPHWIGAEIVYGLEAAGGGTVLRFDHTGFAAVDDEFRCVAQTWAELLTGLRAYAQGGVPAPKFVVEAPLAEVARVFADTVRAVPAEALDGATPCAEFTVGGLLGHLAPVLANSALAARKQPLSAEPVDAAPTYVAELALAAAAAWAEPRAVEGVTVFGPGEMPAEFAP
ncbi:maleylpyruvate isomerase N-terminal domain-containing protein [Streptomyces sp. NPDC051940]|uniref:maleylpyruvate isomerase N-terminal domain-containing protein n=1 Tax=Streptomyces sp. NPDC051940 TaxID=3155675 RepID=UPI00342414B0